MNNRLIIFEIIVTKFVIIRMHLTMSEKEFFNLFQFQNLLSPDVNPFSVGFCDRALTIYCLMTNRKEDSAKMIDWINLIVNIRDAVLTSRDTCIISESDREKFRAIINTISDRMANFIVNKFYLLTLQNAKKESDTPVKKKRTRKTAPKKPVETKKAPAKKPTTKAKTVTKKAPAKPKSTTKGKTGVKPKATTKRTTTKNWRRIKESIE